MATTTSNFGVFSTTDKSNSQLYINRNGQVLGTSSALPATVGQHWIPSQDNTYDLGQNTPSQLRWRDLWISRNASVVGTLTVGAAATVLGNLTSAGTLYSGAGGLRTYNGAVPDIGTSGARFGVAYLTGLNSSGNIQGAQGTLTSLVVNGSSAFGGTIYPLVNGALPSTGYDIGTSSAQWKDIYIAGNIYKGGVLYNPGLTALGDLLPSADNTYVVGNFGNRWKDAWFSGIIRADSLTLGTGDLNINFGNAVVAGTILSSATITGNAFRAITTYYPASNGVGNLGDASNKFAQLCVLTAWADTINPNNLGTPVVGSTVGLLSKAYQNGYIDNLNSDVIVPRGSAPTKTIGTGANYWTNGYFTNLTVTSLTASNVVRGFAPATLNSITVNGGAATFSDAVGNLVWNKITDVYTAGLNFEYQPTGGAWGWVSTNKEIRMVFTLPVTINYGVMYGSATVRYTDSTASVSTYTVPILTYLGPGPTAQVVIDLPLAFHSPTTVVSSPPPVLVNAMFMFQ